MNVHSNRHLEWRHFRELVEQGVPAIQPVSGSPEILVFVDEAGSRIGLRMPIDGGMAVEPSPVAEIEVGRVMIGGQTHLEITTRAAGLFAEFYALLEELADRVQLRGETPEVAFRTTMSNWKALLRPAERMSDEQRIGLFGELLVLHRLLVLHGLDAVAAWTGPLGEQHDFRIGEDEIEVKTTSSRKRVHLISSLEQLEPSPGRNLYLLSIQLEPAGSDAGRTLPELVDGVRALIPSGSAARDGLETALLVTWRYSDLHASAYRERLQMRTASVLVEVSLDFPRLTPSFIAKLPGSHRIADVQYRLAVDGLGHEDGSVEFAAVLPGEMAL